jgi:hypothetical protein
MDIKNAKKAYIETSGLPFRVQLEFLFPHDPKNLNVSMEFEEWKKNLYNSKITPSS